MIVCEKCGKKFKRHDEMVLLVEIAKGNDVILVRNGPDVELPSDPSKYRDIFGCPNCNTDAHFREVPSKYKRKFRKGGKILSLDELSRQEYVFWNDKITHSGWFLSWQFRMAKDHIGENGCIYYAIKEESK